MRRDQELAAYHFLSSIGVLIRVLKRSQHLFPEIKTGYSKAIHLLKEGKALRDMVEHAYGDDGYLAGGGHHPEKFVRENSPQPGISADATATIVNEHGHWLGGRLCVERVLAEVSEINSDAQEIAVPISSIG